MSILHIGVAKYEVCWLLHGEAFLIPLAIVIHIWVLLLYLEDVCSRAQKLSFELLWLGFLKNAHQLISECH